MASRLLHHVVDRLIETVRDGLLLWARGQARRDRTRGQCDALRCLARIVLVRFAVTLQMPTVGTPAANSSEHTNPRSRAKQASGLQSSKAPQVKSRGGCPLSPATRRVPATFEGALERPLALEQHHKLVQEHTMEARLEPSQAHNIVPLEFCDIRDRTVLGATQTEIRFVVAAWCHGWQLN